jgi:chorismate-pyruvate lyase
VSSTSRHLPDLDELVGLFYGSVSELGDFTQSLPATVPAGYRQLLDHTAHMTVTVEAYHRSLVDVQVLDRQATPTHYARKILLTRQSDGGVVQFGIMRMNLSVLDDAVRERIEAEATPLGRILIQHDVLRQIRLQGLWRIEPSAELCRYLQLNAPRTTYGRTAMMDLNGVPAVELLEIVTPIP